MPRTTGTPTTSTSTNRPSSRAKVLAALGGAMALVVVSAGTAMALDDGADTTRTTSDARVVRIAQDVADDAVGEDATAGEDVGSELLDDLASELGITTTELRDALGAVLADRLDERVADGHLSEEQADAALAAFEDGELGDLLRERIRDLDPEDIDVDAVLDRAVERGLIDRERADVIAERAAQRAGRGAPRITRWLD